jgi:hypothetical protein
VLATEVAVLPTTEAPPTLSSIEGTSTAAASVLSGTLRATEGVTLTPEPATLTITPPPSFTPPSTYPPTPTLTETPVWTIVPELAVYLTPASATPTPGPLPSATPTPENTATVEAAPPTEEATEAATEEATEEATVEAGATEEPIGPEVEVGPGTWDVGQMVHVKEETELRTDPANVESVETLKAHTPVWVIGPAKEILAGENKLLWRPVLVVFSGEGEVVVRTGWILEKALGE